MAAAILDNLCIQVGIVIMSGMQPQVAANHIQGTLISMYNACNTTKPTQSREEISGGSGGKLELQL